MPTVRAQPQRPPERRPTPVTKTGPRKLFLGRPIRTGGPGDPPPGFNGPTTSAHEWPWYWASKKVFDPQDDPRRPPFSGGNGWDYQNPHHVYGVLLSVVDFVYYLPGEMIGVRIQTPFFHTGPEKDAYDAAQSRSLSRMMVVKDVFSVDFIRDATGEAAIRLLIDTLGGRDRINPMTEGGYFAARVGRIG